MYSKCFLKALPGLASLALVCTGANALEIVSPNINTTVEGASSDGGPFGEGGGGDFRIQNIYKASDFLGVGKALIITGISYRPDAFTSAPGDSGSGWNSGSITVGMTVRLSTTTKVVDGLSTTFAQNTGADEVYVFNGLVTLSSTNSLTAFGTKKFDIVVNFTTPFVYDPTLGNLLLDTRTFSGGNRVNHAIDAVSAIGDSVSSAYTLFNNGGSPIGSSSNTSGDVVQFTATPVPESSSYSLMLAGLCIVGLAIQRRTLLR